MGTDKCISLYHSVTPTTAAIQTTIVVEHSLNINCVRHEWTCAKVEAIEARSTCCNGGPHDFAQITQELSEFLRFIGY